MIRLFISLCVLLAGVWSFPVPQAPDDGIPQDLLHDFLLQQAFEPEKSAEPVFDVHDVFRFTDEAQPQPQQETVILPEEHQVEAGVILEEAPEPPPSPLSGRGLLARNRGANRRFPSRPNRIPPAEEPKDLVEQPSALQEEEAPYEVEPQEPVAPPPKRRGSRFPLRSRAGPLARGRNRARENKKPTTTTEAPKSTEPETEPPAPEEQNVQEFDNSYNDYDPLEPTTPKPRGILARRRNFSRNTNALFEALRKRRKQHNLTSTTTAKPEPVEHFDQNVPTAAEDSKATAKRITPSRRFGGSRDHSRRRFRPRGRSQKQEKKIEETEDIVEEVPAQEPEQHTRGLRAFRPRHSSRQS